MNFLGDVFLDKQYKVKIDLEDFVFNLEYPFSTSGTPAKNKINLGADIPNIRETFGKFPLAVNLANNHIMDYGEEGFNKTINYLEENEIRYFGAGNESDNYNNPCVLEWKSKKIAFMGYSCPSTHPVFGDKVLNGSAKLDIIKVVKDIQSVKDTVDFVVVNFHWGDEEITYPKATDVAIARLTIDAGADLIIGHHAHVIQSMEVYNNKHIFYGVGNFIFPDFDVPCSYDGKEFLKRSSKIQEKSNKETIIVTLEESLMINYNTAIFYNGVVQKKEITIPKWIPNKQKYYDIYKKIWIKKRMIKIFVKNPRIPNINQVKLLFGIKV